MISPLLPLASLPEKLLIDPVMAAAFATSSQLLCQEKYDVFISFRGSDIRHTFLSHLTKTLRKEGIDVYIDERLESGDEISPTLLEAIEGSVIALVVFSQDYASSRWCLEELVKIMECKQHHNQIVIPVFYNVGPSHVRHQKGSYGYAFAQHEQKFKDKLEMLQIWRSVLEEAANLSGYHYSSNIHNESDLIDGIIEDVSEKLEDKEGTIETERPIGFEEKLATIKSFMQVDSQELRFLGIWGQGGIGKTTLARAVFDKFSRQFHSSYFASNVREESERSNGLNCLHDKILSVLLNDENLTMIKRRSNIQGRLRRKKVLLVLDDVDTSSQLEYLLTEKKLSLLGPSSKIIITSRDKQVLVSGGVHKIYKVKELNMQESLQLFYRHAFKQAYPKMGYEELSTQAIGYAKGLPLALKVLGSCLYSKTPDVWESTLEKLRKHPNVEIQNVLKVSYKGLDIPDQRLFLDIAFFFKGEAKEDIKRVLDACDGFYVTAGIDRLLDKALITISKENRVKLHDLLQEMAEEIVREESRKHPERRSRLNDAKEIEDVLKNSMGTDAIEGIILNLKSNIYLSTDTFHKMRNLRFLKINSSLKGNHTVHIPDGLDSLPNELRYFSWRAYPLKSLPLGFSPEKLVEIHMEFSKVAKLWDGVQDLKNLKIIDLSFSKELNGLPDFSKAQNLEIMDLSYCVNLCSIHPSILSLPNLVSLNLTWCTKLENLHDGEKHLESLKHLTLAGCFGLKEFLLSSKGMTSLNLDSTGIETLKLPVRQLNKLEELKLSWPLKSFQINELSSLTSLKRFSLSNVSEGIDKSKLLILFDSWGCLEELRLEYCCEVDEIPENISDMPLLKILSLRGCYVKSLPNSVKHLSKLKELDLGDCKRLRSLPELPLSITRFYLDRCKSLKTIDFILMQAILYNNCSSDVRICYPGSTIPKGFKYSQIAKSSITIALAPPSSSSDHLLGFASCFILSSSNLSRLLVSVCRKFNFEDEDINFKDEKGIPRLGKFSTDHVFVWYDPMERILKKTRRRRFDEGATYKFACEFFIGNVFHPRLVKYDHLVKACGILPIFMHQSYKRKFNKWN